MWDFFFFVSSVHACFVKIYRHAIFSTPSANCNHLSFYAFIIIKYYRDEVIFIFFSRLTRRKKLPIPRRPESRSTPRLFYYYIECALVSFCGLYPYISGTGRLTFFAQSFANTYTPARLFPRSMPLLCAYHKRRPAKIPARIRLLSGCALSAIFVRRLRALCYVNRVHQGIM